MNNRYIYALIVIIATALFFGGASYWWRPGEQPIASQIATSTAVIYNETGEISAIETEFSATSSLRVPDVKAPDLQPLEIIPSMMSTKITSEFRIDLAMVIAELRKNTTSYDYWLALGTYRKQLEDYKGAALAWEYAAALNPKQPLY